MACFGLRGSFAVSRRVRQMLACVALAALAACAVAPTETGRQVTGVTFSDLPGWEQDDKVAALTAFRRSCPALGAQTAWQAACAAAVRTADRPEDARAFFETYFTPYAVRDGGEAQGLFTGYYVPELRGARQRGGAFQTPLYARPDDLARVDLGAFKKELKGQSIVGKVEGRGFVPYDDRAAIARGSLAHRAHVVAWVDDPVDAFFLEIQGSGHVRLTDGKLLALGYDSGNGRAYVAIGRALADGGEIARPVTMEKIRAWLTAHPARRQEIFNLNPSAVFFRELPNNDVLGAQGVALTAGRSLAVDPAAVPLGAPVWLDTSDAKGAPLQRLMVAQDTGGAIKGVVRGDVFWGAGGEASAQAGAMQSRGRYFVLLPPGVKP